MDIKQLKASSSLSINEVIRKINNSGYQFSIIEENNTVIGIVTDGDIRRAILEKVNLEDNIKNILNKNFIYLFDQPSMDECMDLMLDKGINFLPILEKDTKILRNIIFLDDMPGMPRSKISLKTPVFILAGGFGKRMAPLTDNTPKPMLKIGGVPLLEIIIDRFIYQGFKSFYIATHYLSEQIESYFESGLEKNIQISYLHEKKPLGTAGSLSLLENTSDFQNIIVVNGDLLNKVDFKELLNFHLSNNSMITMATKTHSYEVPYGVIHFENSKLLSVEEKPNINFQVNAGIYVINSKIITDLVQKDQFLDMPSLINQAISMQKKVSIFPIYEYWNDIGAKEDFNRAQTDYSNEF